MSGLSGGAATYRCSYLGHAALVWQEDGVELLKWLGLDLPRVQVR